MTQHHSFLQYLNLNMTELAVLRGVSRQYCTRDIEKFSTSLESIQKLIQLLRANPKHTDLIAKLENWCKEVLKTPVKELTVLEKVFAFLDSELKSSDIHNDAKIQEILRISTKLKEL